MISKVEVLNIIIEEENTIAGHVRATQKKKSKHYFGNNQNDKIVVWPGLNSFDLFYPIFILEFNLLGVFVKISKKHNPLFRLAHNLIIALLLLLILLRFRSAPTDVAITSSTLLVVLTLFILIILKKNANVRSIEESQKLYTLISKYEKNAIVKLEYKPKLKEPLSLRIWTRFLIYPFVIGCIIVIVTIPRNKFDVRYLFLVGILVTYLVTEIIIWFKNR